MLKNKKKGTIATQPSSDQPIRLLSLVFEKTPDVSTRSPVEKNANDMSERCLWALAHQCRKKVVIGK